MTTITGLEQLSAKLQEHDGVIVPTGAGTKLGDLSKSNVPMHVVDMSQYCGITAYEATEFLITAKAGTPLRDIESALNEHGQYLPFDPILVDQGSTIGGCVATGISGPSSLLYGSVRDFVMEVQLVDGRGSAVRGGGKVVKNAAGFDLPKLMVGSTGRLGVMTELTLKVFPQPPASVTLSVKHTAIQPCVELLQLIGGQPLPLAAADIAAQDGSYHVYLRFAGPENSLPAVLQRATKLLADSGSGAQCQSIDGSEDHSLWERRKQFLNNQGQNVRLALHPRQLATVDERLEVCGIVKRDYLRGGTVGWLTDLDAATTAKLDPVLASLDVAGTLYPLAPECNEFMGAQAALPLARRIQRALDPKGRFLPYELGN